MHSANVRRRVENTGCTFDCTHLSMWGMSVSIARGEHM